MRVSPRAIEMIKHHEGVRLKPYRCPANLWTIGVGHVMYPEQAKLPLAERLKVNPRLEDFRPFTQKEVDDILRSDLARFESGVAKYCPVALTQGEFNALVSFSFNVGLGTLQRSTLRQKVLRGDMEGAGQELLKYNKAGGKVLRGLDNRRKDELAMFMSKEPIYAA